MKSEMDVLLALEEERYSAMLAGDVNRLRALFSDDAVYIHSSAVVHDRQGYLDFVSSQEAIYRTIERSEESVKLLPDGALISGRIKILADFKTGSRRLDNRYLSVWTNVRGQWRFVAWQSTPMP